MPKMKIGKITQMKDGASVGYLKESLPLSLDEEKPSDFDQKQFIFRYGKINGYRGESAKELKKKGFGIGSYVAFWADDENRVIKVQAIVF